MLFSHDSIRPGQKELIDVIVAGLSERKPVLAHAPTGLGKTAAALCPAIDFALSRDLTVFFLTSRHTQHKIVLETCRKIMSKNNISFPVVSLVGKKGMCAQENIESMHSSDFAEYCKSLVESRSCEFFENARGKNNLKGLKVLSELKSVPAMSSEHVITQCVQDRVCPYEMSLMLAVDAKVIVADYFYLFNPHIRETLFNKIGKKLEQCIVIVDEGHNLPNRLRDLLTSRLSNKTMRLAIQEAKKHNLENGVSCLVEVQEVLNKLSDNVKDDKLVKTDSFCKPLEKFKDYDELVEELGVCAEMVRGSERSSFIGGVTRFLEGWKVGEEGFVRFVSRDDMFVTLNNRCLDPSFIASDVFSNCYSSIVMSGTLSPVGMYADLLGLQGAVQKSFPSPFPESNRLSLIVPKTSTKFTLRSPEQFKNIARICGDIVSRVPGCCMLFFPSYSVRDSVASFFAEVCDRPLFYEVSGMDKVGRQHLLDRFSSSKNGILLGIAAGSFGEGVDLPGLVKCVVVVGLPLDRPDLETTELIAYYDKKFGKGWEYGYILPAMTKCIQNAGRCIRSETDRGVLVFLEERYAWPRYKSCFPSDWNLKISNNYQEEIARFFGKLF